MQFPLLRCAAALAFLLFSCPACAQNIIHEEKSLYHNITVVEMSGVRCLYFSETPGGQACTVINAPDMPVIAYIGMMLAGFYLKPEPRNILVLGLGGGVLQGIIARALPNTPIDTAEIDPAVFRVAKKYFGFQTSPTQRVFIEDGRVFVKRALQDRKRYDMILMDAFNGDLIPEHMTTKEFMTEIKNLLSPGGVFVINAGGLKRLFHERESATCEAVFGRPLLFWVGGNRVIVAQNDRLPSLDAMRKNANVAEKLFGKSSSMFYLLEAQAMPERDWNPDAPLLTDQRAPANLLDTR